MIGWRESGESIEIRADTHTHTTVCVEGEMKYDGGNTSNGCRDDDDGGGRFSSVLYERPLQNGKHLPGCWPFSHIKKEKLLCLIPGVAVEIKRAQGPLSPHTKKKEKENVDTPIYRLGNVCTDSHDSLAS